jgi:hypothetical protein
LRSGNYFLEKEKKMKLGLRCSHDLEPNGVSEKFGESARTYTTRVEMTQVGGDEWVVVLIVGLTGRRSSAYS